MSDYPIIPGLDRARYEALLNNEILHPLPQNAVLVIGADWCFDTQASLMQNGYPTITRDGRPIVYLNDADPETHALLGTIPGKEILGGGVDHPTPPSRPTRAYNYPTVLSTRDGAITGILYADTVPTGMLTEPAVMGVAWEAGAGERARRAAFPTYDAAKGSTAMANSIASGVEPNQVYAIVSSNCGHCHELLARSNYPATTYDGRPITYLNLAVGADGKTPLNPAAMAFYAAHFSGLPIEGFPTFLTTDANGTASIAGVGPDPIIKTFFPAVMKAEQERTLTPTTKPVIPSPDDDLLGPVGALEPEKLRALGSVLGTQYAELATNAPPGTTPAEAAAKSGIARNG